jgi:hypothetical protein
MIWKHFTSHPTGYPTAYPTSYPTTRRSGAREYSNQVGSNSGRSAVRRRSGRSWYVSEVQPLKPPRRELLRELRECERLPVRLCSYSTFLPYTPLFFSTLFLAD